MTTTVERTIEINVPIGTAHNRRNIDGKDNAGVVTFHKIDDATTRIAVQLDFVPEGLKEKIGSALGAPDRRVKADLERFKEFIESHEGETGAWRGDIPREGLII